jgi:hypothetical protein
MRVPGSTQYFPEWQLTTATRAVFAKYMPVSLTGPAPKPPARLNDIIKDLNRVVRQTQKRYREQYTNGTSQAPYDGEELVKFPEYLDHREYYLPTFEVHEDIPVHTRECDINGVPMWLKDGAVNISKALVALMTVEVPQSVTENVAVNVAKYAFDRASPMTKSMARDLITKVNKLKKAMDESEATPITIPEIVWSIGMRMCGEGSKISDLVLAQNQVTIIDAAKCVGYLAACTASDFVTFSKDVVDEETLNKLQAQRKAAVTLKRVLQPHTSKMISRIRQPTFSPFHPDPIFKYGRRNVALVFHPKYVAEMIYREARPSGDYAERQREAGRQWLSRESYMSPRTVQVNPEITVDASSPQSSGDDHTRCSDPHVDKLLKHMFPLSVIRSHSQRQAYVDTLLILSKLIGEHTREAHSLRVEAQKQRAGASYSQFTADKQSWAGPKRLTFKESDFDGEIACDELKETAQEISDPMLYGSCNPADV